MTLAFRPTSLSEALRILQDANLRAVPVAGCTDLMVVDHATQRRHRAVVDLLRVPELAGISDEGTHFDIGACVTFTRLREHPGVASSLPLLAQAAATVGGWQIQNRATLGGNIANASPAGDSLPALLALDAELILAGPRGFRAVAYANMHTDYRKTLLERGELIARIRIAKPPPDTLQLFRKIGTRQAQAISKVVVAAACRVDQRRLTHVRIAAGSVAPTPLRMSQTELLLEGALASATLADRAFATAHAECRPIDDIRSTAAYRRHVTAAVLRRMVLDLCGDDPTASPSVSKTP